jgi:hypothetical protein
MYNQSSRRKVRPSGNVEATRGKKQHYRIVEIAVRRSKHSKSRLTKKHRWRKLMMMAEHEGKV